MWVPTTSSKKTIQNIIHSATLVLYCRPCRTFFLFRTVNDVLNPLLTYLHCCWVFSELTEISTYYICLSFSLAQSIEWWMLSKGKWKFKQDQNLEDQSQCKQLKLSRQLFGLRLLRLLGCQEDWIMVGFTNILPPVYIHHSTSVHPSNAEHEEPRSCSAYERSIHSKS